MDTRHMRPFLALLSVTVACAGPTRYDAGLVPQVAASAYEDFGPGIESARPSAVFLHLTAPAYVAIARFGAIEEGELVYPLDGADWQEYGYPARGAPAPKLEAGRHRLEIPLPWLRVDLPLAVRRVGLGDPCRFKQRAWACSSWPAWRYQQNDHASRYYGQLPAPDSLAQHHLVVIVSTTPIDLDVLRARLDDMHDSRVTAAAAAQAAPYYLTTRHEGSWGSFATTVRIRGVR